MTRRQLGLWLLTVGLLTGCTFITQIFVQPRAAVDRYAGPPGTPGATTNPCTSTQPCTPKKAAQDMVCSAGDRLILLDGTYRGADYMLDLVSYVGNKSGTSGARCVVMAQNDGAVFIDGEGVRRAFFVGGDYWTFQGFDVTNPTGGATAPWSNADSQNGGASVIETYDWNIAGAFPEIRRGLIFQRICAFNATPHVAGGTAAVYSNNHVWALNGVIDSVFEDICGFGAGRNSIVEFGNELRGGTVGNVIRRGWFRYEGWPYPSSEPGCSGGTVQAGYHTDGRALWENLIVIYDPQQGVAGEPPPGWGRCFVAPGSEMPNGVPTGNRASNNRDPTIQDARNGTGDRWFGLILYGPGTHLSAKEPINQAWQFMKTATDVNGNPTTNEDKYTDFYIDGRTQPVPPLESGCVKAGCLTRVTLLKDPTAHTISSNYIHATNDSIYTGGAAAVNVNECTTPSACPNFYTGTSPGTGSRACFEYTNGVLGSTAATQGLWPWRMDDRIKQALGRARATGGGGSALSGGAGSGYAAGTVTSEIAARYGPIPPGCSRTTTAFVPNFPVATDFPSTPFLDQFNRADGPLGASWISTIGPLWSVASNQAAAPSSFARNLYVGAVAAASHEVYGQFTTMPGLGGPSTILVFAATDTSDVNHYRLQLTRGAGTNAFLRVVKLDNDGLLTTPIGDVDLGSDVSDGQSYGVRVNATQVISVYWKFTDGNWYRIATVMDPTVPTGVVRVGLGSAAPTTVENFGGGTCCGGTTTPTPGTVGRFGNLFPKQ